MKALFIIALCLSLVFSAETTFAESDEICCTWINAKYVSSDRPQKLIFAFDGTFMTYATTTSVERFCRKYLVSNQDAKPYLRNKVQTCKSKQRRR